MRGSGLAEVANPSALFLEAREKNVPGAVVFAGIEGTRPLLVEIQALAAPHRWPPQDAPLSAGTIIAYL